VKTDQEIDPICPCPELRKRDFQWNNLGIYRNGLSFLDFRNRFITFFLFWNRLGAVDIPDTPGGSKYFINTNAINKVTSAPPLPTGRQANPPPLEREGRVGGK
jgi:hypothetical protein